MSASAEACVVAVFAKAPEPGQVKTRLIPRLGADGAARLHARLVWHAIETALASGVGAVQLWCAPTPSHPFFQELAVAHGLHLQRQCDGDLGGRMAEAFHRLLGRFSRAILIGTDCPVRTAQDFELARDALDEGSDAVLGPAEDGGYHLIGLRRSEPRVFEGISWSTDCVLSQTRVRLSALGMRWHELPQRWDLDRPEDYERLLADAELSSLAAGLARLYAPS
jgi:rSAM/selenodomain-associated transferase 1